MLSHRNVGYILKNIEAQTAWSEGTFVCVSCRKRMKADYFSSQIGKHCVNCVAKELYNAARLEDIQVWSAAKLLEALEANENFRQRITVLARFHEVAKLFKKKFPEQFDTLNKLLVVNLGFVRTHPLAQLTRQFAFQTCLDIGAPLTPMLLKMCAEKPWQLYANIIMVLGKTNPKDAQVKTLLEKALQDSNIEIRKRAQTVFLEAFGKNALMLLNQMPLVKVLDSLPSNLRQLVTIGMPDEEGHPPQKNVAPNMPEQVTSAEQQHLEELINQSYTADVLRQIYMKYLHEVHFDSSNFNVKGKFAATKLKKAELVRVFASVFGDESLFQEFLNSLPEEARAIFQELVWDRGEREVKFLEKEHQTHIVSSAKSPRGNAGDLLPEYMIFHVRAQYNWHSYREQNYKYYLSIADELRPLFKSYLPQPEGYDLTPLEAPGKTAFLLRDEERILNHLKLYAAYIAQGNLKYSRSTGKLLKSSLTQMTKYCAIENLYGNTRKDLQHLKVGLILDFFHEVGDEGDLSPEKLLRALFKNFFQHKGNNPKRLHEFLHYLKGGYYDSNDKTRQKRVKKSLLNLLKALPAGKWIAFSNLKNYCFYREIDLEIVSRRSYGSDLYFTTKTKGSYSYNERVNIREAVYQDALTKPFLKTMMFLFGTFGLLDLAYDLPKNDLLHEFDKDYLSPFDGLRSVRLTPLGEYVIGQKSKYAVHVEEQAASVSLDEKRLIMTLDGNDPLKTMVLEKLADKISETCYKVNYQSFLKECANKKDIKHKISLFHKHVSKQPPQNWRQFIEDVQKKINPLVGKTDIVVYKLTPDDRELIALMARDEVLKRHIMKAEDYHVLIEAKHLSKVKKRLEEFGYFIDNF